VAQLGSGAAWLLRPPFGMVHTVFPFIGDDCLPPWRTILNSDLTLPAVICIATQVKTGGRNDLKGQNGRGKTQPRESSCPPSGIVLNRKIHLPELTDRVSRSEVMEAFCVFPCPWKLPLHPPPNHHPCLTLLHTVVFWGLAKP
jgi:hypothetical protein